MKRTRSLALIMTLCLIVSLFAACGSSGQQSASAPSPASAESSVGSDVAKTETPAIENAGETLRVYAWQDEIGIKTATDAYNALGGNQVELVVAAPNDYHNKLFTSLAGGEDIDAYFIRLRDAYYSYLSKGLVRQLDDFIAAEGIDMSVYGPGAQQVTWNGGIYGIPYRGGGYYLYYNKELFDKAGVPYPEGSYTWDEYREVCKQLTIGEGQNKTYGTYRDPNLYWLNLYPALQKGTKIVTDDLVTDITDNDNVKKAWELFNAIMNVDGSMPTMAEIKATNLAYDTLFTSGRAATMLTGDWFPGALITARENGAPEFEWGIAPLPCDKEDQYASRALYVWGCVNQASTKPEAAFDYLTFVGGNEGAKINASVGQKPAIVDDEIVSIFSKKVPMSEDNLQSFFAPIGKSAHEPLNVGSSYANQILSEEFSLYLTGEQDVDTTLQNAATRLNEALASIEQ